MRRTRRAAKLLSSSRIAYPIRQFTTETVLIPIAFLGGTCITFILSELRNSGKLRASVEELSIVRSAHQVTLSKEIERRISSETKCDMLMNINEELRISRQLWENDTGRFLKSLSMPHNLGKWGELSLRRTIERVSGNKPHIIF